MKFLEKGDILNTAKKHLLLFQYNKKIYLIYHKSIAIFKEYDIQMN